MANTFKSAMVDMTSTDLTTIITVPTANPGATPPVPPTTDVVKSILICNDSGSTTLVDNVVIGCQAGISGHLKIGNNVKIGGGSGVINDIPDNHQVMGYPAVSLKEFTKLRKK